MKKKIKAKKTHHPRVQKKYNLIEPGDSNTFLLVIVAGVFIVMAIVLVGNPLA